MSPQRSEKFLLTAVRVSHNEPSLDQRRPHSLAVHAHPTADHPHRDTRSGQPHRLRLLVDPQSRSAARHVAATEMREHGGAVHAVPLRECLDAHPGAVAADERVHVGGGDSPCSIIPFLRDAEDFTLQAGITSLHTVGHAGG